MAKENFTIKGLYERQSPGKESFRRFLRHRSSQVGLVILTLLVLIAIFAPLIAPYDPTQILKKRSVVIHPVFIIGMSCNKNRNILWELMGIAGIYSHELFLALGYLSKLVYPPLALPYYWAFDRGYCRLCGRMAG